MSNHAVYTLIRDGSQSSKPIVLVINRRHFKPKLNLKSLKQLKTFKYWLISLF